MTMHRWTGGTISIAVHIEEVMVMVKSSAGSKGGHCARKGFTLIEILVVVAIIALLIAILLPSLRKAREQGRAVVCASHLDQMFMGILLYTQDSKEVLPHLGFRSQKNYMTWWWPTQIAKPIAYQFDLYACPSDPKPGQVSVVYEGGRVRMWLPTEGTSVQVPLDVSYRGSCDALDDDVAWKFKSRGGSNITLKPTPRRITSFKRPATSIALIEGDVAGESEGGMCFRFADIALYVNSTKSVLRDSWRRHNGRTNMLFLDGHVERFTPEQAIISLEKRQEYY
jgi:prepilin-type N-terminal cleavage/methylation domain-containing protein/prepilin-type processing-associated H-X9-DG protein